MDGKSKQQLGELLVDQERLLEVLSHNTGALDDYPELQMHLLEKSQKSVDFRRGLREKAYTKDEYKEEIFARLDWIVYDITSELDVDFLITKVASLVGDDMSAIKNLTAKEIGENHISKLLHMVGNALHTSGDTKSFPFLQKRGHASDKFWLQADKAYDLYHQGYKSHYKLNAAFKDAFDTSVPQSFIKFIQTYGDPRAIVEWREYANYSD
ncbi:hypothetical protein [Vibrio sp. SCSIO 43136]|uniref:hypothetical protein n=1 Tax=Vibrio sp. SCSIO 43136 TaxID=2819101 RepID=UPI0020761B46|nr:hypothetical protein [Vibrio sp. SCSIO 43136]USD66464.1 hypothetical protein J4N39_06555 [Vibrio sp. SCSIO 43136]